MAMATIDYREHDRQIWEEELDEFIPDRVFDAHCHLFQKADFTELSTFAQGAKMPTWPHSESGRVSCIQVESSTSCFWVRRL